jgi:hypothetical protein
MRIISLSLAALLLCGCAPKSVEVSPAVAGMQQEHLEPKMYLEEKPTKEFALKKERESFDLRPVPELSKREAIVENAMMYLGKRDGGDCSGFVNLVKTFTLFFKCKFFCWSLFKIHFRF